MNTGHLGTKKPHLFYNRALGQWICFHWGCGYVYGESMRGVYSKWRQLSGIISRIGG